MDEKQHSKLLLFHIYCFIFTLVLYLLLLLSRVYGAQGHTHKPKTLTTKPETRTPCVIRDDKQLYPVNRASTMRFWGQPLTLGVLSQLPYCRPMINKRLPFRHPNIRIPINGKGFFLITGLGYPKPRTLNPKPQTVNRNPKP